MFKYISILSFVILLGCAEKEKDARETISNRTDYVSYLDQNNVEVKSASFTKDEAFWESKIEEQPRGYIYIRKLAEVKAKQFEETGDISLLPISDSLYHLTNTMVAGKKKAANYIALSSNAITQHQFQNALDYAYKAMENTDENFGPSLMVFDAAMELGLYDVARRMMVATKNMDSFDYLVRLSKFQDYEGNLDSAIVLMEKAFEMVKRKDSPTALWAQSNLADMYGHDGQIEKSYNNYLGVLKKNPNYSYALKGIAWVAYANDKKTDEAWEIFEYLVNQKELPDYHLQLAELADYQGDNALKKLHTDLFLKEATQPKYKGMYNKYLVTLYAEEYNKLDEALRIAKQEINNRSTPMTYGLLAWVYENKGEHKKALEIIQNHVEGKSFEPDLIYKSAVIYASNDLNMQAKEYFVEAADASYELGPVTSKKVNNYLSELQ